MVAPKDFAWSFIDVAVFDADRVCVVAGHDESMSQNNPNSMISRWAGAWSSRSFAINAVSVCIVTHPERSVLVVGNDGTVIRWDASDFSEEYIDTSEHGPRHRGNLREVNTIGRYAHAVGMGRTVYRCEDKAHWVRIDQGVRADVSQEPDAGLNSIDGFAEDDLYAVGWKGEIWHYDGSRWSRFESPEKLALQKVVCTPDGHVYALGQRGVIIRGRADQWDVVDQDETVDDFWGACWFQDRLYATTANGLFVLNDDKLSRVDVGLPTSRADCFYRLSSTGDCIWSLGEKMLLRSTDGVVWDELPYS